MLPVSDISWGIVSEVVVGVEVVEGILSEVVVGVEVVEGILSEVVVGVEVSVWVEWKPRLEMSGGCVDDLTVVGVEEGHGPIVLSHGVVVVPLVIGI